MKIGVFLDKSENGALCQLSLANCLAIETIQVTEESEKLIIHTLRCLIAGKGQN